MLVLAPTAPGCLLWNLYVWIMDGCCRLPCPPSAVALRLFIQHRQGRNTVALNDCLSRRHYVIQNRVDDRTDVVQNPGHMYNSLKGRCMECVVITVVMIRFIVRRFVRWRVLLAVRVVRRVDGDQSLGVERSPTDQERHYDCHWIHNKSEWNYARYNMEMLI